MSHGPARNELIGTLQAALAQVPEVQLAILFGSQARGTHTDASDIDLAVKFDPGSDVLQLTAAISKHCQREVQLISLDALTIPLLEQIVRDGIVVFQRSPRVAGQWWSTALSTLALDGPWYARMRDSWLRRVAERGLGDGRQ